METVMKPASTYSDPIFEAHYSKLETEQKSVLQAMGKEHGQNGKPESIKAYSALVISLIRSAIQQAIDFNYSRNLPASTIGRTQDIRSNASEETSLLKKESFENQKKIPVLESDAKHLRSLIKNYLPSWLRFIIPALCGLLEGGITYSLLQDASYPFLFTFSISATIAVVTVIGIHIGANFICKAKTRKARWYRQAAVLLTALAISTALGLWRADAYNGISAIASQVNLDGATGSGNAFSPLLFTMFTFAAFAAALACEVHFWKSDDEKKKIKDYETKRKELAQLKRAEATVREKIGAIKNTAAVESNSAIKQQELACSNERRLVSLAHYLVSLYESTNLEYQSNGHCPEFFGEQINFEFKLYFTQLFTN